ncbi:uncharacterized protein DUF2752 [Tissierella praeacuta]|uniref:DUF2752 domain-containing protein n=1 Tax=Tissierella praeacuta TaxID=43131 RepID=UPI0010481905|nr:DUF2752 domain-containing protein [Tissierella praeacuta]TCU77306.1 uncharacterized protein DUF2752 [Tissierella praeacuta]
MLTKKEIKILLPIIIILVIFIYFADPLSGPIIPCIFNRITGFYCPGCGMTRALHSILRFDFYQAFRFNSLIFIVPPIFVIYYIFEYNNYIKVAKIILILMIVIALGFGIIRNTIAFSYLSPIMLNN